MGRLIYLVDLSIVIFFLWIIYKIGIKIKKGLENKNRRE